MADEEVDLNPTSTRSDAPEKRARPTDTAPESGPLDILVYPVVLKSNADTFTKSRIGRLIKIPDGQKHISDGTAEESVISAGAAHGLVVNFLASAADDIIAKISSGDGEITEYKLVGDRTADYNFNLSGPFFEVNDGVRLLCSEINQLTVFSTSYGRGRFSTPTFGAPYKLAVGLLLLQGNPTLRPLTALQLQSQIAKRIADPAEGDITSQTLINTGTTNIPKYMKAGNSVSAATSVSYAQMTFYSYPISWHPLVNIPRADFWGRLSTVGATSLIVNSYSGRDRSMISMKSTAEKIDQARILTASELVDKKTLMSALLGVLKTIDLLNLLDFDSPDCSYCSVKDIARNGQQHIDALAIIFSGSQNGGVSYCSEDHNPFQTEPEDDRSRKVSSRPPVSWKEDWRQHFPTMAVLDANSKIPKYLFTRGFIKKTKGSSSTTPTSSSNVSSSSASTAKSEIATDLNHSASLSPLHELFSSEREYSYLQSQSSSSEVLELDLTSEKNTSRQLFTTGDPTDNYVIDRTTADNKGYCSILMAGAAPFDMEFNLDETCSVPRVFDTLPGTHKWMLYRDILKGDLIISCGTFLSITSIRTDMRVTCCQESVGPSDVLFKTPPQQYKLHRDYFRMPSVEYPSPISIDTL